MLSAGLIAVPWTGAVDAVLVLAAIKCKQRLALSTDVDLTGVATMWTEAKAEVRHFVQGCPERQALECVERVL